MQKPIIRHCKNCQWHKPSWMLIDCTVKYNKISFPRLRALFCRYFTKKESEADG